MNRDGTALVRIRKEIELELRSLHRVVEEYEAVPGSIPQWIITRIKASLIHDFYTGLERIFTRIAQELNGGVPNTEQWHRDLLRDMTIDLDDIRPPVISDELERVLLPYLRFRHLFRNLYGYDLEWEKMTDLDSDFEAVTHRSFSELGSFLDWMRSLV